MEHVLVVGASLAGLRAAEVLRSEGFDGTITVVGDEAHRPYDRPPLSKQVLTGEWPLEQTALPAAERPELDVTWELGVAARSLDVTAREVTLADGRVLGFDGLVLACGAAARTLAGTEANPRVLALRTLDDAGAVRAALDAGASRVVVVGAGFIGSEVAASCSERGIEVTLVEPLSAPLVRVLGPAVGEVVAGLHRDHGVEVRLGVGVDSITDGPGGAVVALSDGTGITADLVVVGIGVIPNTAWLEGSGLTLRDGIVCDETTLAGPGIVAAGDVARWPNPRYGGEEMRVEHWEHAVDMGSHAARRLLAGADGDDGADMAYAPVPWFWSDQYDRKLQLAGRVRPDDAFEVVAGSLDERRFCALYGRDGQVTGVLAMNMPAKVVRYRRQLAEPTGLAWDRALAEASDAAPPTQP